MATSVFCMRCGRPLADDAQFCPNCGATRGGGRPGAESGRVLPANTRAFSLFDVDQEQTGNLVVDFLMFRRMIIPILIRVLFVVALVICVFAFLISLIQGNVGAAVAWLIGGPLAARLYGELFILLFVMNDTFTEIRRILNDIRTVERARGA